MGNGGRIKRGGGKTEGKEEMGGKNKDSGQERENNKNGMENIEREV